MSKNAVIIVVVALIVIVGAFVYKMSGSSYSNPAPSQSGAGTTYQSSSTSSSEAMSMSGASGIATMKSSASLGSYMVDPKGMTLYTYGKDTKGVSNCSGECLANWPAYTATGDTSNLPQSWGVIKRSDDGSMQYTYNGMPLYYYAGDKNPGDTNGQGLAGLWYVVK